MWGRTPRWVRGLKCNMINTIEWGVKVAPHDGCVDWNFNFLLEFCRLNRSHPTMGAWIEIFQRTLSWCVYCVAPHDGCVDWNRLYPNKKQREYCRTPRWVRGLKSAKLKFVTPTVTVAPHDGCVDWNISKVSCEIADVSMSHPTMGAWIEIDILRL